MKKYYLYAILDDSFCDRADIDFSDDLVEGYDNYCIIEQSNCVLFFDSNQILSRLLYIGKAKSPSLRWNGHKTETNGLCRYPIHKYISMIGSDSCRLVIIENYDTSSEVNAAEKFYIKYYNLQSKGFNVKGGGEGGDRGRIFSDADQQEIIRMYNDGVGTKSIMSKFNMGDYSLDMILRSNNISKRIEISIKLENEIIKDYIENSMRVNDLAIKYNILESRIYSIFRRKNIETSKTLDAEKSFKQLIKVFSPSKREKKIIKDYNKGLPLHEIMNKHNVSQVVINKLLILADIPKRPWKTEFSRKRIFENKQKKLSNNIANIIALYNDGLSIRQIAKKYKTRGIYISKILTDNNIKITKSSTRTKRKGSATNKNINSKIEKQIVLEYVSMQAIRNIAKKYHIGEPRVVEILKNHNIVLRPNIPLGQRNAQYLKERYKKVK